MRFFHRTNYKEKTDKEQCSCHFLIDVPPKVPYPMIHGGLSASLILTSDSLLYSSLECETQGNGIMKTHKMKTLVVAMLIAIAIVPTLFAQGTKDIPSDAIVGKIVSIDQNGGTWQLLVRDANGIESIFRPAEDCKLVLPLESFRNDDYVAIVSNGIMAQSLPPQGTALEIRWINPLVAQGLVQVTVPRNQMEMPEVLEDKFSYSYGFMLMNAITTQGIFPDAGYFAKGVIDSASGVEPLMPSEEMYDSLDAYQNEYMMAGIASDSDIGNTVYSIDDLATLPAPADTLDRFSYGYGYLLVASAVSQGFELTPYMAGGALDAAFADGNQLFTETEMEEIFNEYSQKLWSQMEQMLAEMAAQNLEEAEAFLAENKNAEGVQTTDSGLQYKIEKIGNGVVPNADSTVRVDYQLSLLDGQIMDSSYERGVPAEFQVSQVIPGFAEAITMMPIGTKMRIWVHPSLGYGEGGTETIEPNSLLIFDLEILGIVE